MGRLALAFISFNLAFVYLPYAFAQADDGLSKKPITTLNGSAGDLLRRWWQEGTAAGNVGDWYDNRDGAHSDLNTGPFPQLQRVVYSPEDIKAFRHWAFAKTTRPNVTFGNSSTSAPAHLTGSNPRSLYCSPQGMQLLFQHYTGNNLYIYPEHRDHDPGHNGPNEGFGDLYPTNTPYLLISQGSSGSDQPFMRAIPLTLAAFRPETKKKLVETGLLMPTVQMILRKSNKHLKSEEEYFTGKAHPSVFEGSWVDESKMVQLAHQIPVDKIPPLVRLKVEEEETAKFGRDYFDLPPSEKLADTPGVIARIARSVHAKRKMVVSAADSKDANGLPLTFRWVLLRGDPERVKIVPKDPQSASVEITYLHQERRPIAPSSAMESNRVDLGVFAENGHYASPPSFVTWFSLDQEARVYGPEQRLLEVGYGMGEIRVQVTDWKAWIDLALANHLELPNFELSPDERKNLDVAKKDIAELHAAQSAAQAEERDLRAKLSSATDKSKLDAAVKAAQAKANDATRKFQDYVDGKGGRFAVKAWAEKRLRSLLVRPTLGRDIQTSKKWEASSAQAKNAVRVALDRFQKWGYAAPEMAAPATEYAKFRLEQANSTVLSQILFPGTLNVETLTNYVDRRLSAPRQWRDVYHHAPSGEILGWTRYDGQAKVEFHFSGLIIEEKDERGRCLLGRVTNYRQAPGKQPGWNSNNLEYSPTDTVMFVEYENEKDLRGRPGKQETRPLKKSPDKK